MSYFETHIIPLAQENFLQRVFFDALVPEMKYLAACPYEEMQTGNGDTIIRTVPGLMNSNPTILAPGKDLQPETTQYEHFVTSINQYGGSLDIPTNQTALTLGGPQAYMAQKMKELATQAGMMTNRMARDAIIKAYLGGNAVVVEANGNTTSIHINSLNGFWEVVKNGKPTTISVSNPRVVTIAGAARNATGYTPDNADYPDGPGTLTLSAAINAAAGDVVLAADRSRILRPKNSTFDKLAANDGATIAMFRRAAAELHNDSVGPNADGFYHVHCAPYVISELQSDNEFQRMVQGMGTAAYPKDGSIGTIGNLRFFSNNQAPQPGANNSGTPLTVPTRNTLLATGYWGELYNKNGVQVQRSVVIGAKAVTTLYSDESKAMLAEAGQPVGGRPTFTMVGNQIQMMASAADLGNIRITIRPPIDRAGQQVAASWTTTRGFPVYCNLLSGQSAGRFKRAMVVETGFEAL